MFLNVEDAIYYIEHIKRKEKRENLNRMNKALRLLGNPHKAYKVIHVAGTNGKGSTVCYITNILKAAGYNVGSFISPYVIKFNERIMLNMNYISDEDLLYYANKVYDITKIIEKEDNDIVTFFEFITLMGLLYFKDKKVDYAVVEVGMGGILDATNVFDEALRCITSIGFDHMNSLGSTLEEIASKKLGIVHNGDTLITTIEENLYQYFKEYCTNNNAKMIYISHDKEISSTIQGTSFVYKNQEYTTPLLGEFQAYNAMLAIEAVNNLNINISYDQIKTGLLNSYWPGRLQLIKNNPTILIDGGHNIHGIDAVVDSIKKLTSKKIRIVFCALKDKEIDKMIHKLEEIAECFYFTQIDDMRSELSKNILKNTNYPSGCYEDYKLAIENCIKESSSDEIILITGSLHFISNVIAYFNKK